MAIRWTLLKSKARIVLEGAQVREAPVPVEALAAEVNAVLRYQHFDGEVSGMVHCQDGKAIIGINSSHPETRQRFTIAHEIGHLLLHQSEALHVDDKLRSAANFRN